MKGTRRGDRGAVVVIRDGSVALIERRTPEREEAYYLFPGGGAENGETCEEAAVREALEELGLEVRLGPLLATVERDDRRQRYYLAEPVGGQFGSGSGEELRLAAGNRRGTYAPVWVPLAELTSRDVRPRALAALLHADAHRLIQASDTTLTLHNLSMF